MDSRYYKISTAIFLLNVTLEGSDYRLHLSHTLAKIICPNFKVNTRDQIAKTKHQFSSENEEL